MKKIPFQMISFNIAGLFTPVLVSIRDALEGELTHYSSIRDDAYIDSNHWQLRSNGLFMQTDVTIWRIDDGDAGHERG